MNKLRKQQLTPEKMLSIGRSYRQMYILAALMDLEYTNFMDINFKSPITHQKISQIKANIDHVMIKHQMVLDRNNTDNLIFALDDLNDIVKLMTNLTPEQIKEFAKGFVSLNQTL
jgi:hypothetical protein